MKQLFLLLALFSINSWAGFVSGSKANLCNRADYTDKISCESVEGESCYKIPEDSGACGIFKLVDVYVDDTTKPIRNKKDVTECVQSHQTTVDEDGNTVLINGETPTCDSALAGKVCSEEGAEKFINEAFTEVYCTRITGYEQVLAGKELVFDEALKTALETKIAQEKALAAAMGQAAKAQECGKTTQQLLLVRNAVKNLSTTQVKDMVALYAPVKSLLDTGSLNSAVEEIQAVQADGLLITEADKTALIDHINKCKP